MFIYKLEGYLHVEDILRTRATANRGAQEIRKRFPPFNQTLIKLSARQLTTHNLQFYELI